MTNARLLTHTAFYAILVFTQQILLLQLPNISFTIPLLALFISFNSFKYNVLLIFVYVFLINLIFGFSMFTIVQLVSYSAMLLFKRYSLRKIVIASLLMMWVYVPYNVFVFEIDPLTYLIADIPFTTIFVLNNVLIWLLAIPYIEKIYLISKERYGL